MSQNKEQVNRSYLSFVAFKSRTLTDQGLQMHIKMEK